MQGKKVPKELKCRIIEESLTEGCVIRDLANCYDLATKTIYSWRSNYRKSESLNKRNRFVELSVKEEATLGNLQSVTLKFADLSFEMQGKIKSSVLISIITMLEETC